jgi:hypothetical protein
VASETEPSPTEAWRPAIGDVICTCDYRHLRVVEINPEDDDVEVVVEGGGSYSLGHCGLEPVPHQDWEHYPSLPAVLSTAYSTATWPELIASLYRDARDAAINGVYSNTKSLCRQALRVALESAGPKGSGLIDLIAGGVGQGKLPVGIQEWATEINFVRSEGNFQVREDDASDALLFTASCLQLLHDASRGS